MTILVFGDANADLSATIQRYPAEGDDSTVSALSWGSGGMAANVAAALALLGERTQLLARVGRDPAATIALRVASKAGADLSVVQRDDVLATGLCYTAISPGGERTFFAFRGANVAFDYAALPRNVLDGACWLHLSGYGLLEGAQRVAALALLDAAHQRAVPVSLDLCLPVIRAHRHDLIALLPRLHTLFSNEPELTALCPDNTTEAALAQLVPSGTTIAYKCGAQGSVIINSQEQHRAPAFAVDAVDTNGCGDAFAAAFIAARLRGETIGDCARWANAAGALTATECGAAEALPDTARLHAFLAQHK